MGSMKWRRVRPAVQGERTEDSGEFEARGEIELALGRRGVPLERCESLARSIEPKLRELEDEEANRVLDGVAFALVDCLQATPDARQRAGADGIEARLFRDFAREIQKLDETVKVLNAYLKRLSEPRARDRVRRLQ